MHRERGLSYYLQGALPCAYQRCSYARGSLRKLLLINVIDVAHSFPAVAEMIAQCGTRRLCIVTYDCVVRVFVFVADANQITDLLRPPFRCRESRPRERRSS